MTGSSGSSGKPAQLCLHCLAITGSPVRETATALGSGDQKLIRLDKKPDTEYKVKSIVNREVTVIEL